MFIPNLERGNEKHLLFQKSFKNRFRCRFVPGHDAEEAEAQDQAAEHGADGQPSVGPRHRIRRRTGIRRRLLVVRSSRGREHPGAPDQSGRHLRFADSRDGRLKRTGQYFEKSTILFFGDSGRHRSNNFSNAFEILDS